VWLNEEFSSINHNVFATVLCPPGTSVIAGGADVDGQGAELDFTGPMRGGSPWSTGDPPPDGWAGSWHEVDLVQQGATLSMDVWVLCGS